jgi:hypothetical protein
MKKSNILMMGAAALVAIVAVSGVALMSYAQSTATGTNTGSLTGQFGPGKWMHNWSNLTEEQKAQLETKKQEWQAAAETKRTEMNTAINGGYETWTAYVKKNMGENAPILSKITADNFSQYAQAHNYLEQARTILTKLGVEDGGFGSGLGLGKMGGGRGGCHGFAEPASSNTQ